MKNYFYLSVALILGLSCVAYIDNPPIKIPPRQQTASDPCQPSGMRWFLINLDCAHQIQFSDLTASGNYTQVSETETEDSCTGTSCVCAIFACPSSNGIDPVISSGTSIYSQLFNYWYYGDEPQGLIKHKDDAISP